MTNKGRLFCLDALTGKTIWKFNAGRRSEGSPVWADGKIYLTTHEATFLILEDKGNSCKLIDKLNFKAGAKENVEIYASPAVSDGRLVIFTTTEMACFGKKDAKRQPVPAEKLPAENAAGKNAGHTPASPSGSLLLPRPDGEVQGRCLRQEWQTDRPRRTHVLLSAEIGQARPNGVFTAGKPWRHRRSAGRYRHRRRQKIAGAARVRVVPDLPISEDFESYKDGDIVGWWSGVSKAKYVIQTLDGSKVLKKISNGLGPVLNRSLAFITPPIPAGYTVEADVRGARKGTGDIVLRGDAGIVNSRYVLEAYERGTKLRVVSWVPGPRFAKSIDFNWPEGKWLRMKLKVEIVEEQGKKVGKVYAKAWPRRGAGAKLMDD